MVSRDDGDLRPCQPVGFGTDSQFAGLYSSPLFGVPIDTSFPPNTPRQFLAGFRAMWRFLADPSSVVRVSIVCRRFVDLLVTLGFDVAISQVISILVIIGEIASGITVIHKAIKWLAVRLSAFSTEPYDRHEEHD